MRKIKSRDGTEIGFQSSGAGPALLLVHGTTADQTRWSTISPKFEQHFTVYAMDRRGRGESGDSPNYHFQREAEDIAALAGSIGEPVSVLGHSYGGMLCLEAALLTDQIKRLILYEPPLPSGDSFISQSTLDRMYPLIEQGEYEAALEVFFREVVKMPEYELKDYRRLPMWKRRIELTPTIPRELEFERKLDYDIEKFSDLQVPTMLLQGGDSPAFVKHTTTRIDATLPNSKVVILPGQQHIAMDTAPELFAGEVLRFLRE
jgi:pimeloyl-ACP methyl ester carboxylesterase